MSGNNEFLVGKTYTWTLPYSYYLAGKVYSKGEPIIFTVCAIHPQRYETGTVGLDVTVGDYPYQQSLIQFNPSQCHEIN